jgi:hypothetical protein
LSRDLPPSDLVRAAAARLLRTRTDKDPDIVAAMPDLGRRT